MKALTIKAPWAQAIVYGTKRIENRTWKPHADVIGKRIAIHCGRSRALTENYSGLAARNQLLMAWNGPIVPRRGTITTDLGHIIGTARVVGWVDGRVGQGFRWRAEALEEMGERENDRIINDFWWLGPIGWLLDDVRAVEPVAVRGQVGLWTVPDGIELIEIGDDQ